MNKDAVILIPSYNPDEAIMQDFLKELSKKFKNIVIVNDGSTDNSPKIITEYIDKFHSININLNYILKTNSGVASTINYGLKYVNTDFFCLPDADDYLELNYIEECSNYLINNKDCSIVFTKCSVFYESFKKYPCAYFERKDKFKIQNNLIVKLSYLLANIILKPSFNKSLITMNLYKSIRKSLPFLSFSFGLSVSKTFISLLNLVIC